MNSLILPASSDLIREIVPHIKGDNRDFSCTMVVFPGKRPAHFLRKALSEQIGSCFIPPAIYSMDEFVDEFVDEFAEMIDKRTNDHRVGNTGGRRKLEAIDAVSVLYDIHIRAADPIGGRSFMSPDSFFPLGLKIYHDLEELYIDRLGLNQVKDIQPFADESVPEQTLNRLQSLAFFYDEFYKTVEEKDYSTRSWRYVRLADNIGDVMTGRSGLMIFAGFHTFTAAEKTLFRKLREKENCLFIFRDGPGLKQNLEEAGIKYGPTGQDASSPQLHFYRSPDTHGQVYALNSVLGGAVAQTFGYDEKTAIVLPTSETLFPLLRQGLSGLGEDEYNISTGYPLLRTPVFGFISNLMELSDSMEGERLYLPDYLKFVLHPYTKNIYFRGSAEVTRIMFHALEEGLTETGGRTFLGLSELEGDEELFRKIAERMPAELQDIQPQDIAQHLKTIHDNTVRRFRSFGSVGDFAAKCGELLTYIFNHSTARLHPLFYPFSESFMRSLDIVSRSLMKDISFAENSSYFSFFRKYVSTCHSPFEGTPLRGLQVLGFLETRNLRFEKVFILDANEDILPDTGKEDTLLPFKVRRALGLPTYVERDRLAAYYFETLIRGAKEAHIFFVENDRKERSRFVEKLLWEKQKVDRTTDDRKYIESVRYRVQLTNKEAGEIKKTDEVVSFLRGFTCSATALDMYLKCPLRFYYSYVLGTGKKEEISGDIERADIGRLVHKLIAEYFAERRGRPLTLKDIDQPAMDRLVERHFTVEYGTKPVGALYLLKKQIALRMKELLAKYYAPLIDEKSVTVLQSEKNVEAFIGPFKLKGRIDSVEQRDDKTCIIDFKTGSNPARLRINFEKLDVDDRASWEDAVGSLQLPFYLMLYSESSGRPIDELEALFLLLGMSDISKAIELPLFGDAPPAQSFAVMKEIITRLLNEITDKDTPFRPARNKKENCPICDFRYLCGTQWIVR